MELESLVRTAYRTAISDKADQVEVFGIVSRTMSVYVEDSAIKNMEQKVDQGIAVRVAKERRLAQSSTSCDSVKDAEACARAACRLAELSPADKNFRRFPDGGEATFAPRVWDEKIASLTSEDLADLVKSVVDCSVEKNGTKVPKGMIRTARAETRIVNSNGVDVSHANTMAYLHFTAMTIGERPGEGVEVFYTPHLSDVDPFAIGKSLKAQAKASAQAVPFRGRRAGETLLTPGNLSEMILSSVGFAIDGENVHRRRSAWAGKVGQQVASPSITIVDDPGDERGMLSSGFDDEGVPTAKRTIVEKGVLKGYIYDSYCASLAGVEGSGNGLRRSAEDAQGIYRRALGIQPINLILVPGKKSRESLISSVEDGVLIERFAYPEVNPFTGAFGLEVRCGHLIRNGEMVQTFNRALLVGNMFEALMNVNEVANDMTVVRSSILPTVSFDGIELVGSS